MRSPSGRETVPLSISSGRSLVNILAAVLLVAIVSVDCPAGAAVSLVEMARLSAADRADAEQILALFHGYASLGLRAEAVSYLERNLHLARLNRETATPLFEEAVAEQLRWQAPGTLIELCEAAIRNGSRTPPILYSYGTALRQAGRLSDAAEILAQVPPESPWFPFALYALGQVAVEEGGWDSALEDFRRVRTAVARRPNEARLARRAALSEAELLLTMGRTAEARQLQEEIRGEEENPLVSLSLAAAVREERESGEIVSPEESVGGRPVRERILYFLLRGGLERDRGMFGRAIGYLARAEEDLAEATGSTTPPATEMFAQYEETEMLTRQIEAHQVIRRILSFPVPGEDPEAVRDRVAELLVGLLFMDHTIARARENLAGDPPAPEVPYLASPQIALVFRKIEEIFLGGVEVDRLVEDLGKKVDVLQNLAHPIRRYRLMTKLEKSQEEVRGIKERVRMRREAAIAGIEAGRRTSLSVLLTEVGRFLEELEEIRTSSSELREFTRTHFNIFRRRDEGGVLPPDTIREMVRDALAFDGERFESLLPSVKALEERARVLSWEREKQELRSLRPVISRQMSDALVAQARSLRTGATPDSRREGWAALRRAMGYLQGDLLSPGDRIECAIHIGSLLTEGAGRWESFPGSAAGDPETEVIGSLLPLLESGAESGGRREEASYLLALLRITKGDRRGWDLAKAFLRKFPRSPYAGHLAVRLGHRALLEGRLPEAAGLYRKAADGPAPEAAGIARFLLGWAEFAGGDARGATRELAVLLSDPSFPCGEPDPLQQEILALSVRAWREIPLDALGSYPPVAEGGCGAKHLLASLGEEEKTRGEPVRAAAVYDLLARRLEGDQAALSYEKMSVEELLRAGKEDRAFERTLHLAEKYGPGSAWAMSQPPPARERAREELAEMLKSLSERKFEEGLRSGESSAMRSAKAGMERFFAIREGDRSEEDTEFKLKWAIASLKAGDRASGIDILEELAGNDAGSVGERAGILYAETMIAGYERDRENAEGAEASALLLLGRFPSEKAVSLAQRAAAAFLGAEQYDRAARVAEEIEQSGAASRRNSLQARLIRAESSAFLGDLASARRIADSILSEGSAEADAESGERARDLYLLASLKEVEAKSSNREFVVAARILEELEERFPKTPEAPSFGLRAMRLYRLGDDMEAVSRTGEHFLETYPRREEAVEIAGILGPYRIEREEFARAADLYATVAERFPGNAQAPGYLFLAARISEEHGDSDGARKRYSAYRARYSNPRWMTIHSILSLGVLAAKGGESRTAIREMEEGIRRLGDGVEKDAPREFFRLAGQARIAVGEHWAEQFRNLKLVAPLERNLALKDKFFQRALALFDQASAEAPLEEAIDASLRSGDLYVEFGRSILDSQRPNGLEGEEREGYEKALKERSRSFFERAQDWYAGALERLVEEQGPADLGMAIRKRIEETRELHAGVLPGEEMPWP